MISAFTNPLVERSGFETLPSQCVVFLGKALLITFAMPLMILSTQKYKMGTGKLSGKPDEMRGGNLAMELASHPEGRGGKGHAFNDSLHPGV